MSDSLAQAFDAGVRWRERERNDGIMHQRYIDANNPYLKEPDEQASSNQG